MAEAQLFYYRLNVAGVELSFRSGSSPEQMEGTRAFVEEQFERLKNHGGQYGRDQLLTLLVLGVADELLQSQRELDEMDHRFEEVERRLADLLKRIENANDLRTGVSLERT